MTAPAGLSPNALEGCPSRAARVRHAAHGALCVVCEPEVEWRLTCPRCVDPVTAVGGRVEGHDVEGVEGWRCDASGIVVAPPGPRLTLTEVVRVRHRRLYAVGGAA